MKATTQPRVTRPTAVQMPISRTGRMLETASAPKPIAAASVEAVTGEELVPERGEVVRVEGRAGRAIHEP